MTAADHVFAELDPDAADFSERFRDASPALQTAIRHIWHEGRASEGLTYAERDLWALVWSSLSLTREGYDYTAEARDTLIALRQLRDYGRMDRAMTAAACELSRLRRRLMPCWCAGFREGTGNARFGVSDPRGSRLVGARNRDRNGACESEGAVMLYRAQICGESSCGIARYVIVEWSRDERQALRRARQRADEARLTRPSQVESVTGWPNMQCDDCGRVTSADCLRTDVGNHPVCQECAAKAVRALEPPTCVCGVELNASEHEHGDLCTRCEDEAHERDTFDHERIHSSGYGGSI